jgi:hypothetical protein
VGIGVIRRNFEWGVLRVCGGAAWREHDEADRAHALDRSVIEDHLDCSPGELAAIIQEMKYEND